MKNILLLVFLINASLKAQIPSFTWLKNWGLQIEGIGSNNQGHVYAVGRFQGTVDFDPGPGIFTLTTQTPPNFDGFILELDAMGQFVWAGSIKGAVCWRVEFDQLGNVYVLGIGSPTTDLDPGPGTYTVSSSNQGQEFILKLNPLNQFTWGKAIVNTNANKSFNVSNGYIYCAGSFTGTPDFDPGPAVHNITCTSTVADFYILKLDLNGNLVWVVSPKSSTGAEVITMITVDGSDNVYAIGQFSGSCDFNPATPSTVLTSSSSSVDYFFAKYSPTGALAWVKQFNNSAWNIPIAPLDLYCANNLLYIDANYGPGNDFDLGPGIFSMANMGGSSDIAYAAYDLNCNFKWARAIGGTGLDRPYQVVGGPPGKIYSNGRFASTVDFDPGPAVYPVTANGNNDFYMLALDSAGNFDSVGNIPSPSGTQSTDLVRLTSEPNGNLYLTSLFNQNTDFDFSPATYLAAPTGTRDAFVLKMSLCPSAPLNLNPKNSLYFCSGNSTTLTASSTSTINWYTSQNSTTSIASGSVLITPTLAAGSYTWYAAAAGCSLNISRLPIIVHVTNTPSITVSSTPNFLCAGSPATLTASGATTYTWLPSGTGSSINFVPGLGNNSFTVIAADLNCASQKTIQVQAMPIPTVAASVSQPVVCAGQTVQLSASGASTYAWLPLGSGAVITVTTTAGTIYTVTGSDNNCSSSATIQVQANPLPVLSVNSPTLICNGALVIFTVSGADTYSWNNNPGTTTYSFVANGNGTLNIIGTNSLTSCNGSATKIYTVSACTSIKDLSSNINAITIYPNPASGKLYFKNIVNANFLIYDSKGMNLGTVLIDDNGQADISTYSAGFYFIIINTASQKGVYKLIKE